MTHETLVIGGGSAGMMAAIVAKDHSQDVAIIEGGNRVGRKLITTGNGRCNITNRRIKPPYENYHSQNEGFFRSVLDQLTVDDTIGLFYSLGLPIVELTKGRMYPQSLQASSVVDILRLNLEERNVPVYLETKVVDIRRDSEKQQFIIETNGDVKTFYCRKLIIAAGGISAANTGSDGTIHQILSGFGHRVTPMLPTIVQLKLDYPHLKAVAGVRFDALAMVSVDGVITRESFDEVLFTPYGISGPAIYDICRDASVGTYEKKQVKIHLDLFPQQSLEELSDFFEGHFAMFGHRSLLNVFNGVIHKKLVPALLKDAGITDLHMPAGHLDYANRHKLCRLLKDWTFICYDTNGFQYAQGTIGGIDTQDVDPDTLQSKLVDNLYFCGEVLDVDGDCGGFNLQWAWSSAYVSGKASSQSV